MMFNPVKIWAAALFLMAGVAEAQSIRVSVDSSLADHLLGVICTGRPVDEAYLRESPALQSQIKHHSNMSPARNMEAFVAGLKAAAKCETPSPDPFRFGTVVKEKAKFEAAVAFFKGRGGEIEAFAAEKLTPYVPQGLDYKGDLVLSIVGNPCGGFAMDGRFFLALPCLRDSFEEELETAKIVSAHEIFHAVQYAYFHPFDEDIARVTSLDDAFDYHFMNLLLEGTAEYVADSRGIAAEGGLSDILRTFAGNGYGQVRLFTRFFSDTADILTGGDDTVRRLEDIYGLGYSGGNGQPFYYVGAAMAGEIEKAFGRVALVCIMAKPPEQFVRAYQAAAMQAGEGGPERLGDAMMTAADRLSAKRAAAERFEACRS